MAADDPRLTDVAINLTEIADWWDEIHTDRNRGTPRRWAERHVNPADGHERTLPLPATHDCGRAWSWTPIGVGEDADGNPLTLPPKPYCAVCEGPVSSRRLQRSGYGAVRSKRIGASPAPGRLDVTEAIIEISGLILGTELEVRRWLGDGPPTRPIEALRHAVHPDQPDEQIPAAARYLHAQLPRIAVYVQLFDTVERATNDAVRLLRRAVGTGERTQALREPCPVCGRLSLVAFHDRDTPELMRQVRADPAAAPDDYPRGLIVCTANRSTDDTPLCECQLDGCPCHWGGRHYWPRDQWRRLGVVLDQEESLA